MISFVFSGQGSQSSDMGQSLYTEHEKARSLYQKANQILGYDLLALSDQQLSQTQYAQPAILTLSLALWEVLTDTYQRICKSKWPWNQCVFSGFSLGEYTALGTSGILEYAELISLVQKRAEWMQDATLERSGAMAAVIGLSEEKLAAVINEPKFKNRVFLANFNAPDQIVISGDSSVISDCIDRCLTAGARRVCPLPVNGAFHTPFMTTAAESLFHYAKTCHFQKPRASLYKNSDGKLIDPDMDWPSYLADHLCRPVRWVDEMNAVAATGINQFIELGPDKTLSRLIRRILPRAQMNAVTNLSEINQTVHHLTLLFN